MLNILFVDDHPMMTVGLSQLFEFEIPELRSYCASTYSQALSICNSESIHAAVVDISLSESDRNGIDLVKEILQIVGEIPILVLSMHDEEIYGVQARKAGARGYIQKQMPSQDILEAFKTIFAGGSFFQYDDRSSEDFSSQYDLLSDRELQIFKMIGEGLSPKAIGELLFISTKTVEAHRVNIRKKLTIETAQQLSLQAHTYVRNLHR